MENIKSNLNDKTPEEILIEQRIKSGEEIEITIALEILSLLKKNIPLNEISTKTNRPISDIEKIKNIFEI